MSIIKIPGNYIWSFTYKERIRYILYLHMTHEKISSYGPPLSQKDTHGSKTGIFSERKHITPTKFRAYYERGDLPVVVDSNVMGIKLRWKVRTGFTLCEGISPATITPHLFLSLVITPGTD